MKRVRLNQPGATPLHLLAALSLSKLFLPDSSWQQRLRLGASCRGTTTAACSASGSPRRSGGGCRRAASVRQRSLPIRWTAACPACRSPTLTGSRRGSGAALTEARCQATRRRPSRR